MEVICINDTFTEDWEAYFRYHGIQKPVKDKIYTIRQFVTYLNSEKSVLLNEIRNNPTPRKSTLIDGLTGEAEQTWKISRFTDLLGNPVEEKVEELVIIEK